MTVLSDNAQAVATSRYFLEGEDWAGCCKRVANAIAANENGNKEFWAEKFYNIIFNMKAIPGGRVLRNAGTRSGKVLNCHVLELNDSINSIGRFLHMALVLNAEGGGVGCAPKLRPKGAPIKLKGGNSSGMLSFLEAISAVLDTVESGGNRRSGCLPIIDISHPEVVDIMDAKLDHSKLNNFNISIGVTNKFLDAVEQKEKWKFQFDGVEYGEIWAPDLFSKITENMLMSGEPGIVNLDKMKITNTYYYLPVEALNLCQPEWATVLTKSGIKTIKDISINDEIWSSEGWTKVIRKGFSKIDKVYKYRTTSSVFYGTQDHKIVSNGEKIEVDIADSIDSLPGYYKNDIQVIPEVVMGGLVLGDGSVHKASNNLVHLFIGEKDQDYFTSEVANLITKYRPGLNPTAYEIRTDIKHEELPKTFLRKVPDRYKFGSRDVMASFLRGLYSANGSVIPSGRKYRIQLAASSFSIVEDVQLMLSALGIRSYVTSDLYKKPIQFSNGVYTPRASYIVNITGDREKFYSIIGFIQQYKMDLLYSSIIAEKSKYDNCKSKETFDIVEKEFVSEEAVYYLTVDNDSHTYWSGGSNVGNCGELNLPKNTSCVLGSLVLPNFQSGSRFSWDEFGDAIRTMVRMLDNVLDMNVYSFPEMKEATLSARRIGIGIMGLGSYLINNKIKYGSQQALNKIDDIIRFMRNETYKASIELAKERGPFPGYIMWPYMNSKFIKQLPAKIRLEIKKYGIRNSSVLSFPPSGTTSLITDVTSGIEPLPYKAYKRKDRVGERTYINPLYKELLLSGEKVDYFVDALDLDAESHFETTATIQRLNDSSISKTQSLPSTTTHDQLKDWLLEYSRQLVGLTVYVDGCRKDQIYQKLSEEEVRQIIKEETKVNDHFTSEDVQCSTGKCEI